MDSYTSLLERTRVPQPSLQKFAVISIFEKLRSAPTNLGPDSDPGRHAITYCLNSTSPAVVDQAVRELCRIVKDSKMDISGGLLELQCALEACDYRFVTLFVKALGFLINIGFQKNPSLFQFQSTDTHPYVKILSCRTEVQCELLQQVVMFLLQNKHIGMVEICEFLRPFLNYSIIRMQVSATFSSFVRNLVSSISSLSCSFPKEAVHLIKLLIGCIKYFPCRDAEVSAFIVEFYQFICFEIPFRLCKNINTSVPIDSFFL